MGIPRCRILLPLFACLVGVLDVSQSPTCARPSPGGQIAEARTRRTKAEAIAIAREFTRKIGAPVAGTAVAVFPAPTLHEGAEPDYWLPCWRITFSSDVEVDVVDRTGLVSTYADHRVCAQMASDALPGLTPLSKAQALSVGARTLRAAGAVADVGTPTAEAMQLSMPPTSIGSIWYITWPRLYQGHAYRRQEATVVLQADGGAVTNARIHFPSPAPTSGTIALTRTKATAAAAARLAAAGISGATLQSAVIEVVQPNRFWQVGGSEAPIAGAAHLAWVCGYTLSTGKSGVVVYVDAASGAVDGGGRWDIAGHARVRPGAPPAKDVAARRAAKVKAATR